MSQASGDRLTNPDTWRAVLPDEVFAGLVRWAKAEAVRVTHRRWLTGGRSGSFVAVVRLHPDGGRLRHVILKLVPPGLTDAETAGVKRAERYTPDGFSQKHLVETLDWTYLPNVSWSLHLQQIARADVAQLRPLTDLLDEPDFGDICCHILGRIVTEWSSNQDPDCVHRTSAEHLEDFLRDHRDRLAGFAARHQLSLTEPDTEVWLPGRAGALPNPFALLADRLPASREKIDVFVGNGHGDLHLGNILVPVGQQVHAADFRLIDLGRFSPTTPVSRDPVKLALSVAAAWLPALVPGTPLRSALAELVVAPMTCPAAPPVAGYLAVMQQIYTAGATWFRERSMDEDWARQYLLLLIGSALRTVADEHLPEVDRWWFFEVAALATRAFVDPTAHTTTPPTGPSHGGGAFPAPSPGDQPPVGPTTPATPTDRATRPHPVDRATPSWPVEVDRAPVVPTSGSDTPRPSGEPVRYPGRTKVEFGRRLGTDWRNLADILDVPPYDQARFTPGWEPQAIWEWLEVRRRLSSLRAALADMNRADLVALLDDDPGQPQKP